jgi:hypothetical protein
MIILCDESIIIFLGKYAVISVALFQAKNPDILSGPFPNRIERGDPSMYPMSTCFISIKREVSESHLSFS